MKGLLSIVETPDKNLLPFRSDPGIPKILLSARRGPSPSVRRVEMEGVQGKGRRRRGKLAGAALRYSLASGSADAS